MKKSDLAILTLLVLMTANGFASGGLGEKDDKADLAAAAITINPASKDQLATLEKFQKRLTAAGQMNAKIRRKTVIGLLGQEKQAEGNLQVSKGRVRMDLKAAETDERHLLVVGPKAFWAVTYPPKDLEGALVQVVTGPVKSKKAGSGGRFGRVSF